MGQNPNVYFLVMDSHAWADKCAWNPHVSLSSPFETQRTGGNSYYNMINNARGMPLPIQMHAKGGSDFQCVVTHGWQPCMRGHLCMEPNKQILTYAKHEIGNPWGTQSVHRDPFQRHNRLPMCSFLWGQPCMGGHLCMEAPCTAVRPIETQ